MRDVSVCRHFFADFFYKFKPKIGRFGQSTQQVIS